MEGDELILFEAGCSGCGLPYVGSLICTRPALCWVCFAAEMANDGRAK